MLAVVAIAAGAGCAPDGAEPSAASGEKCPTDPVNVVVSVNQWSDVVTAIGGRCVEVTTVLAGSAGDPHDFEPAPADAAAFTGARLVVVNGGHYDEWATKLAQSSAPDAPVVDAVEVGGGGENPHVWYRPATVVAVADALTARLGALAPDAAGYVEQRRAAFGESLQPYFARIDAIRAVAPGRGYAATENVFDDMAAEVGLTNRTPPGYAAAVSNESEPSPADVDAFLTLLRNRGVDVLIVNTQTRGAGQDQLRAAAQQAQVPVVEVTETMPADAASFPAWQVEQLTALAKVLGAAP